MIDRATVEHVARLARLGLSPDEIVLFGEQLSRILAYVEQIGDAAPDEHAPAHPSPARSALRPDVVTASLDRDVALANAPEVEAGFVRVPAVLE